MLRLTELKLPLDHTAAELEAAIAERLEIEPAALLRYSVAKRGNDARRKSAIKLVYALDVTVVDEPAVLARDALVELNGAIEELEAILADLEDSAE